MITIWDWFERDLPMKERYKLIKQAGFDGLLMWWSNGFGRDSFGKDDYLEGPVIARNEGLYIENIHAPIQGQDKLWKDNLDGKTIFDSYLKCIDDCDEFGIPTIVIHLPSDEHPLNEIGLERVKQLAETAAQKDVNIAFENLRNFNNLDSILINVVSDHVGLCYDSAHHYKNNREVNILGKYGTRLMAMHLHDNNGGHGQHGLPFDGEINWLDVLSEIAKTGYTGATALEPMKWDYTDMTTEQFLRLAYKKAKRLDVLRK